ncbi:MAG: hypothetical protein WB771_02680 [Solirubrobacterales bacterium]
MHSEIAPEFARACHSATPGNPFFLHGLLDELERDHVEPTAAAATHVLNLDPRSVSQAILARLARLSEEARALARAVAVLGDDVSTERAARLVGLAPERAPSAADELARASIFERSDALRFAHPITRNAVYGDLGRGERADLHRRTADLLRQEDAPRERVAAQLMALDEIENGDPEIRQGLESIVLATACIEPAIRELADELAARVRNEGIEGDGYGAKALASGLLYVDARAGIPADEAIARAREVLDGGILLAMENGRAAFLAAVIVVAVADSDLALPTLDEGLELASERGDISAIAGDRLWSSYAHLVRGELMDAIADGEVGLETSAEHVAVGVPWAAAHLALAQMERGDLDEAERSLGRAATDAEVPDNGHWHAYLDARAQLKALRGDLRGALADALESGRRFAAVGGHNPAFLPWRSRAALCLHDLGEDAERAGALAAEEVELAEAWGAPRALGVALRAKGLVVGGDEGLDPLRESASTLEGSQARLEQARSLVDLGAAMRRGGNRAGARGPLKEGSSWRAAARPSRWWSEPMTSSVPPAPAPGR